MAKSAAKPKAPTPAPAEPVSARAGRTHADAPDVVLRLLILRHLTSTLARHPSTATSRDWWVATALAVRDTIHERLIATQAVHNEQNVRRIYYFSLEYLMGRLFGNNLLATGLLGAAEAALKRVADDVAAAGGELDALLAARDAAYLDMLGLLPGG